MSQQFSGVVPRICEERVSYREFGKRGYCTVDLEREDIVPRIGKRKDKSYKENENTEVDIIDTKREQETSKKRSRTEL